MTDKLLIDRATIAQALEALELRCGTNAEEREPNGAITALRAALAQANAGNPITDYWFEHYVKRGLCSLCGNYGVIDTRGTRTPAGVAVGALHFCICPNGQKRREAGRALAQEPEPVQEPACSCSLRGRLVGDGCEVCNPELAAELRQQPEPVQEPVAWMWKERVNGDFDSAWRVTRCEPPPYAIEQQPLYTAPTPRKPETEQEPVAWRVMLPDGYQFVYDERMLRVIDEGIHATRQPLYTTPPQRPPLTDEEILAAVGWERSEMYMKLVSNFPVDEAKQETLKNARAVERKVRGVW
jgi:hypothetical protein